MNRMLKSFFATLAILGLLCTGAFAQDKSPSTDGEKKVTKERVEYLPATIEKAQQALKQKGLYKGEATGKIDPATKDAVKAFQQQEGLKPSGHLNKDTRVKLGLEAADSKSVKPPKKSTKSKKSA